MHILPHEYTAVISLCNIQSSFCLPYLAIHSSKSVLLTTHTAAIESVTVADTAAQCHMKCRYFIEWALYGTKPVPTKPSVAFGKFGKYSGSKLDPNPDPNVNHINKCCCCCCEVTLKKKIRQVIEGYPQNLNLTSQNLCKNLTFIEISR